MEAGAQLGALLEEISIQQVEQLLNNMQIFQGCLN